MSLLHALGLVVCAQVVSVLPDDHGHRGLRLSKDDATARALIEAIHAGDVDSLRGALAEHQGLVVARLVDVPTADR
jgi:hypothetical protein